MNNRHITQEFRTSYVNIHKPQYNAEKGKNEYKLAAIFETPEALAPTIAAFKKWLKEKHPNETMESLAKKNYRMPFGKPSPSMLDANPWVEDMDVVNLKWYKDVPPEVIDIKTQEPILLAGDFYSGCYARAAVTFYEYNNKTRGFSVVISSLLKTRDGERLGGAEPPASEAFSSILTASNAEDL